jgi:two-component system, NtrC family, sensor histidine kinase PilS
MAQDAPAHSWFGPTVQAASPLPLDDSDEIARLWQTFMTARLMLGIALVALQGTLMATGSSHSKPLLVISGAYFMGTLASRLLAKPGRLGKSFNRTWLTLVGLDVIAFSVLQFLQGSNLNYTPLFALPILLASVLGSLRLALGTAAGITVLLLASTLWTSLGSSTDPTPQLVQAALSGVGYFAIALLANQLSRRLVTEGQRARISLQAARMQQQVNELVIESLPDGVLIVDHRGSVRAANPAARQLLGSPRAMQAHIFDLRDEPGWLPLLDLTRMSVGTGDNQEDDITIRHPGMGPLRVRARTRLACAHDASGESLCVMFLQDLRELEARMRTEKLASMGRMSTAVAHEIRNPLAAIAQANALLEEDISDPRLKRLTTMVSQNAKRLDRIVDDILNVSRVQPQLEHADTTLELDEAVQRMCQDWASQSGGQHLLGLLLNAPGERVRFDSDHLRRVLVNLLDNARRHTQDDHQAIQVSTQRTPSGVCSLSVWSDAAMMDQSIERHLFEPFFSSESRSSGLGLYICRELCESHGGSILYQRNQRSARGYEVEGNEFVVSFAPAPAEDLAKPLIRPWQQPTLY